MKVKRAVRFTSMMAFIIAYFGTSIWLYVLADLSFGNKLLLDIPITLFFVVLWGVVYAATGGDDETS